MNESLYSLFAICKNSDGTFNRAFVSCDSYDSSYSLSKDIALYSVNGLICLEKYSIPDNAETLTCDEWTHTRTYFDKDGKFTTEISGSSFKPKETGLYSVVVKLRDRVVTEAISERHGMNPQNMPVVSDRRYAISGYTADGKNKVFLVVNPNTLQKLDQLSVQELKNTEFKLHEDVIVCDLFL